MQTGTSASRRLGTAAWRTVVGLFSATLGVAGCGSGAPGVGGGGSGGGATALEGQWLYLRVEGDQLVSGDCVTITSGRVTEFINNCDGEDRLVSSEDITRDGPAFVIPFSITVESADDAEPVALEVAATLTRNGSLYVGTERLTPPAEAGHPVENQVVLRRP